MRSTARSAAVALTSAISFLGYLQFAESRSGADHRAPLPANVATDVSDLGELGRFYLDEGAREGGARRRAISVFTARRSGQ